ncbi:MAG: hypothetical protein EPN85_06910 [Bacteroidetes bacterium]|nr:MAG: hypothetical protein EPN85_06910 [Bacteroidota bacterium]
MITIEKYREYFVCDDGAITKNAPICLKCTEDKFQECLRKNEGCEEFQKQATERGWNSEGGDDLKKQTEVWYWTHYLENDNSWGDA